MKRSKIQGRLSLQRKGYGFVRVDDPDQPDVFVPARHLKDALDGDLVRIRLVPARGRHRGPEGRIIQVLQRDETPLLAEIRRGDQGFYALPLGSTYRFRVQILEEDPSLEEGLIVAVKLLGRARRRGAMLGEIVDRIGRRHDSRIGIELTAYRYGIKTEFDPETITECARLEQKIDRGGREDLREQLVFTIDGEDARDFDDAISVRKIGHGRWELGVHIADVSHYVRPGSRLDREAFERGTSIYFPQQAIHMLPEDLSIDLCSLVPDQDRLTVSVWMELDSHGTVRERRFSTSIIRSRQRLTYAEVQDLFDRPSGSRLDHDVRTSLLEMRAVARLLLQQRHQGGALTFELPEVKVSIGAEEQVIDLKRGDRYFAHSLIEEFMLLANGTVAEFLMERRAASLFRVHEPPAEEEIDNLAALALQFGHRLIRASPDETSPKDLQKLASKWDGRPEGRLLSYQLLRSLQRACYNQEPSGHFGLATKFYTHFTSPIRRYPDLIVHRLLKHQLSGNTTDLYSKDELQSIARQSSERESAAADAEREMVRRLAAELMQRHVGEHFEATVHEIRPAGVSVELSDYFLEGWIPLSGLWDDYYEFEENTYSLRGKESGRRIRLGDTVTIRIVDVDVHEPWINMVVIG